MKNKTLRILIAGANPYNANKGVAALAFSTIRLLNEVAREMNQNLEICEYTHETSRVYDYVRLPEGKITIHNIFPSDLFGAKRIMETVGSKWKLYNLRELYKCDYIFNITAGDSFSDIYGIDNFNAVNKINRIARKFGIGYSFLPQTYGPFYNADVKRAAFEVLSKADLLLSRDRLSTDFLKSELPDKEIKSYVDVAFYLPFKRHDNHLAPGVNVGINISQTLWNIPCDNKIELTCSYKDAVYSTINHLLSKGCIVHIVPHVVDADNHEENEYYLSYRIWEEFNNPNVRLAPLFLSPVDAKSYISALDMFIGARMHACIAAFSSGVPVLPMSYSRKFEGLFDTTLGYKHIFNLTKMTDVNQLIKKVDEMMDNRSQIGECIRNINETVVAENISGIKDSIKSILASLISRK